MNERCKCKAQSTGKRCTHKAVRTILEVPICGPHIAILKKTGKVAVMPAGTIRKTASGWTM